ncbi:hypothetical protein JCM10213_006328 [Rhodosporidiobolus nylandii]
MKVEYCNFSGYKIYPGKGKLYVRSDSKIFRFVTSKEESLFLQRKNPRKISWTVVYRRVNKKGVTEEVAKKRSRKTVKANGRGVGGADLASILAKRNQKPEVREAQRAAALAAGKDKKKEKESKKVKNPSGVKAATGPKVQAPRGKGASRAGGR